ncbi:hypothetical protein [Phytobacter sp. AG2a]
MTKNPDRPRGAKTHVASIRHDDVSLYQVNEILKDNPLYTPSHIIRGAIQALFKMNREDRETEIMAVADRFER